MTAGAEDRTPLARLARTLTGPQKALLRQLGAGFSPGGHGAKRRIDGNQLRSLDVLTDQCLARQGNAPVGMYGQITERGARWLARYDR